METGCEAVNMNDYLGNIYIYNAGWSKNVHDYTVIFNYNDRTSETSTAVASFDLNRMQVVFTNPKPICMTRLELITFNVIPDST